MTAPDPHLRTELGAYVLGALEPAERHLVEAHLADCASCRDELGRLSVVPPLLDALSAREAVADLGAVRDSLPATVAAASRDAEQRLGRQVRRWRAVASITTAAAAVLVLTTWAPWEHPPDAVVAPVSPLTTEADAVGGTVEAYAWEWGTTVAIEVEDLPAAEAYTLWAVSDDGHRERAGTWGATPHRAAQVRGASAIQREDLARVEVTSSDGRPLFDATFVRSDR